VSREEILAFQGLVRRVPVAEEVVRHAVHVVRATRPGPDAPEYVRNYLAYGASVRAAQAMILGGKARAVLHGRSHVAYEDIHALAKPVMRHRLLRTFQAQADRVNTDEIIARVLDQVRPPRSGL
jgi:MoxR-like ATPase